MSFISWARGLVIPNWIKVILNTIKDILISVLTQVGKAAMESIRAKIIEVAGSGMDNKKKFQVVSEHAKALLPQMKDSALNLLLEALVSELKAIGKI